MKLKSLVIALCCMTFVFSGCASVPMGPSVVVMPPRGKPFEVFQNDDKVCREFAKQSIGANSEDAATKSEERSIAAGTALGLIAGLLGGGNQHSAGKGAAIGMVGGAVFGSGAANSSENEVQRRYNIAYMQCMYSKGNNV